MKMRVSWTQAFLVAVTVSMASCAGSRPIRPPQNSEAGMIFGNLKVPGSYDGIFLWEGKAFGGKISGRIIEGDHFFFENLEPGFYILSHFYKGGVKYLFMNGDIETHKKFRFEVKPGGIVYIGSFEVTGEENNIFTPDRFEVAKRSSPAPQQILKDIQKELKGTGWDKRIEKKLKNM